MRPPSFPLEIPSWDGFLFELPFADSSGATQSSPGARIETLCKFKWMQIGRRPVHTFELPSTGVSWTGASLGCGWEGSSLREDGSALWCYLFRDTVEIKTKSKTVPHVSKGPAIASRSDTTASRASDLSLIGTG